MFELKSQHCSFTMSNVGEICIHTVVEVLKNTCKKAVGNKPKQKSAFSSLTVKWRKRFETDSFLRIPHTNPNTLTQR